MAKRSTKKHTTSGYVHCACRDCFDITIADYSALDAPMCHGCKDAGCSSFGDSECLTDTAYGCDGMEMAAE